MGYKSFLFRFVIHLIILVVFIALFFWSLTQPHLSFTKYGFAFLSILNVVFILYLMSNTYSKIHRFLKDFVIDDQFPKFKNNYNEKYFTSLKEELDRIADSYGRVKLEKEKEHIFLKNTVEHYTSAIIAFDSTGNVVFVNSAFRDMFGLQPQTKMVDIESVISQWNEIKEHSDKGTPEVIRINVKNELKPFTLHTTKFKMELNEVQLISFTDISRELINEGLENWKTLIRILRHEIINSITPITTVSETMVDSYDDLSEKAINENHFSELLQNSFQGFKAIQKRGEGLMHFVDLYKTVSSIPELNRSEIVSDQLIEPIITLYEHDCRENGIDLKFIRNKESKFFVDEKLTTQVIINIIKNAIESFDEMNVDDKKISIQLEHKESGTPHIKIADNGKGFCLEVKEKAFVPFFTTKQKGSGIGLSYSQMIMNLHGGYISVNSVENNGTTVVLHFG